MPKYDTLNNAITAHLFGLRLAVHNLAAYTVGADERNALISAIDEMESKIVRLVREPMVQEAASEYQRRNPDEFLPAPCGLARAINAAQTEAEAA
ncbi:hypothetical protein FACS1894186_5770 [Alphaproteobacteria bacterium]|nr:hypothetical protein FACS1894186_5770 [Alphaproteobacteria bacterium]